MPTKSPAKVKAEARQKLEAAEALRKANEAMRDAQDDAEDLEGDDGTETLLQIPEAQPSKLESVLAEIGSEGTFQVYIEQDNGADLKLGQFDIQDYPQKLETLARKKGGGTLKVVFRNAEGHYKASTTRTYDPDTYGAPKSDLPVPVATDNTAMVTMLQNFQMQMMKMQMDSQERSDRMMIEMMKLNQGNNQSLGGLSIKDIKELIGSGSNKSFAEEARAMIETLALLRDDGGLEPENPWVSALSRGMIMLKPFLEAGAARLANPGVPDSGVVASPPGLGLPGSTYPEVQGAGTALSVPASPPPVAAPVSVTLPPAPIPADMVASTYGGYGSMLYAAAEAESEAGATARFVLDNCTLLLEADNLKTVSGDLHVVDRVIQHNPAIEKHRQWLVDFFAEIKSDIDSLIAALKEPEPTVEVVDPSKVDPEEPVEKADSPA